jgi:hypothetical protein
MEFLSSLPGSTQLSKHRRQREQDEESDQVQHGFLPGARLGADPDIISQTPGSKKARDCSRALSISEPVKAD